MSTMKTRIQSTLSRDLIAIATGKIRHRYMGGCPDTVDGHDRRDKTCRACRIIIRAEAGSPPARVKSEKKSAAARENGKKGGRPAFEWLVITTARSLDAYAIWGKRKTEAAAIELVAEMGRNAMEGHTLAINIADRAKYGV